MMATTVDDFTSGKPAAYVGFDGKPYVATYLTGDKNGLGVGSLQVKDGNGTIVRDIVMGQSAAQSFFLNLNATAED